MLNLGRQCLGLYISSAYAHKVRGMVCYPVMHNCGVDLCD